MFRYIGFSWNPAHPTQDVVAQRLNDAILRVPDWQPAIATRGLCVYIIGSREGVNGVYPLPFGRGVVLGRLFRRRGRPLADRDVQLCASEANRILETGGQSLINDYWGRYVAVLQSDEQTCSLLRDPSGALPCFLKRIEDVAIFFSWLEDLIAFSPEPSNPCVDWRAIATLTSLGELGGCRTALEDITQVLPGRRTCLDPGMAVQTVLWSVVASAGKHVEPEPEAASTQLRQVVIDCVGAWSSCYDSILLRLSGGLDSAILLGSLAASPSATQVACLNYHSRGSDSDERGFARLAARRARVELIEMERDASFRLDCILSVSRMPSPVTYLGRMDASRIDAEVAASRQAWAIFAGVGGDQLFFQRRCTWPAADYLGVHGLDLGFPQACLDSARLARVSLWRSMRSALADQRPRTARRSGFAETFTLVHRDAIDAVLDFDRYSHPDMRSAQNLPVGKFHQVRDLIDPIGYYDPYRPEAAPELVNPLLSQPVIELCLGFPTWLLTVGGRSRALVRQAFSDHIPQEISRRQSKGGMDEHVAAILDRNLPFARELLLDGQLVRRGLLDRGKVEAALTGRLSGMSANVSEIHHHLATEAWLQGFVDSSTPHR